MKKGTDIFNLKGKSALITGATGYLGSSMTIALAEAGAHVMINSRSEERSREMVRDLINRGYSAEPAIFDITNKKAIDNFFKKMKNPSLNILINNAYEGSMGNIEHSQAEAYSKSFDITMIAAHNILNAALPYLREAVKNDGDSSVINISSMYGIISPDQRIYNGIRNINPPFYGAAKAALISWTRYAACEFGHEGIRVNSISPGAFPSILAQEKNSDLIKELSKKVPLGRIGISEELKGPALFLSSSASSYVNGSNIVVDGGWTSW